MKTLITALTAAAIVALASACTIGSPTNLVYNADDEADTTTATTSSLVCSSPFVSPDLSTLTACGSGTGHCYDADKVPSMGTLPACAGTQVCVPDTILTSAGKTPLKTCNSVIDKPGACVSMDIAEIKAKSNQLTQDVCAATERCIPCVDPLDNTPTPFCAAIGVHQDACTKGGAAAATEAPQPCCVTEGAPPQGLCMSADNVPAGQRGKVGQDVCQPSYACVPAAFVNNDPVACSSDEGSGFCMDQCFVGDLGSHALLRGDCPNLRDKCVPCSVGKGEGLPGC